MVERVELEEFVKILKEIIFLEREIESSKIELALKSDFNIIDAFKMLDIRGAGAISQEDMKMGLCHNLNFSSFDSDDIYMLFRRFDAQNVGHLTYQDFNRLVLPFSREYAGLITDRADFYSRRLTDLTQYFNFDTRKEMIAFWNLLFQTERSIENLRMSLRSRPGFNFRDIFEYFSRTQTGVILESNLRDVLAENGFYITERELQGLMYRMDRD